MDTAHHSLAPSLALSLTMRRRLRHSFRMLVYFALMAFFSLTVRRSPLSRSDLSFASRRAFYGHFRR